MKRLAVLFLAIAIFITIKGITPCYAEDASTQVSQEPMQIEIGVSSVVPLVADELGAVASSSITISNNSYGPIVVTEITLNNQDGWQIVEDYNISSYDVGTKKYAMEIDSIPAPTAGSVSFNKIINGNGESLILPVTAKVAPQKEAKGVTIANMIVSVEYAEDEDTQPWLSSPHANEYVKLSMSDFTPYPNLGAEVFDYDTFEEFKAWYDSFNPYVDRNALMRDNYLIDCTLDEVELMYANGGWMYTGSAEYVIVPKELDCLIATFVGTNIKGIAFESGSKAKYFYGTCMGCTSLEEVVNIPDSALCTPMMFYMCPSLTRAIFGNNARCIDMMYQGSGVTNKEPIKDCVISCCRVYSDTPVGNYAYTMAEMPVCAEAYAGMVNPFEVLANGIPRHLAYISEYLYNTTIPTETFRIPDANRNFGFIFRDTTLPETFTISGGFLFNNSLNTSVSKIGTVKDLTVDLVCTGDHNFEGFVGKESATSRLTLTDNVRYLGRWAFQQYGNLAGELVLPRNLEYINDGAFNHCSKYSNTSLTIPKSVKFIGHMEADNKLPYDYKTDRLIIPVKENYGTHVFNDFATNNLREYKVEEGNTEYKAIDGVLYSADGKCLVAYPTKKDTEIFEVPEGVTTMYELGFSKAMNIKELVLPDSYVIDVDPYDWILNKNLNSLHIALYWYVPVEKITVKPSNPNYKSINGLLYSKNGKSLWYIPNGVVGQVNIAEGTERLESGFCGFCKETWYNAGENCTGVRIPASVNFISPTSLKMLNSRSAMLTLTVDPANTKYQVVDGKIVTK